MNWSVYLAGEIHSQWRSELSEAVRDAGLPASLYGPVTDHQASDDCGSEILGDEPNPFWHDRKGAGINALRTRTMLGNCDIVVLPHLWCQP